MKKWSHRFGGWRSRSSRPGRGSARRRGSGGPSGCFCSASDSATTATTASTRMNRRVFGTTAPRISTPPVSQLRCGDVDVRGAEDVPGQLLQHQPDARSDQQRVQRPGVHAADRAVTSRSDAHRAADQEADEQGDEQRHRWRSTMTCCSTYAVYAAGHDELAVGHVDDAHLAEGQRQAQRDEQQHRADAEAGEQLSDHDIHRCTSSRRRPRARRTVSSYPGRLGPGVALQVRVGLDRRAGVPHRVDQAVGADLTDAGGLGDVLVGAVDGDQALRGVEGDAVRGAWMSLAAKEFAFSTIAFHR